MIEDTPASVRKIAAALEDSVELYSVETAARAMLRSYAELLEQHAALKARVEAARNAMIAYANENPKHLYNGVEQDPNGVHAWLAANQPGEQR